MISWCTGNADRFDARLSGLLDCQHHRLLVSNHLERLFHMSKALENKAHLFMDLLDADRDDREITRKKITRIQENARHLSSIVENAIPGAVSGITREIELHLDEAFAKDAIQIRSKIINYVHQTALDAAPYSDRFRETGIKKAVYLMFQDFRRGLDLFVMTDILPEIKTLVFDQENPDTGIFSIPSGYLPDRSVQNIPGTGPNGRSGYSGPPGSQTTRIRSTCGCSGHQEDSGTDTA